MPVTLTILTIPSGSQLVSSIDTDEPESKNDFRVLIALDANGTGLTESNITFSTGASLVELTGSKNVWEAVIRPPETAGTLTITVAADAFTEGNAETSQDIRISTEFPDDDAELPSELFTMTGLEIIDGSRESGQGIAITPTRILVTTGRADRADTRIRKYTFDHTEITSERLTSTSFRPGQIDYINGDLLFFGISADGNTFAAGRYNINDFSEIETYPASQQRVYKAHSRLGFIGIDRQGSTREFVSLPYGTTDADDVIVYENTPSGLREGFAAQGDTVYMAGDGDWKFGYANITSDDTIAFADYLNIGEPSGATSSLKDISIYRDTFYSVQGDVVYSIDIKKYRPLNINTKTTIYPIFATNGDTLPLSQFCPDAKEFTFSVGFDKPDFLSINSSNEIAIASNAVSETTPVLVKLTGINYIDSVDFEFYLIIVQAENPTVRDVDELTMRADSTYDLFGIVSNATSIAFRTGQTQPTDSSINNGVFTIGTASGTVYFTATNDNGSTHFQIEIDVVSVDADTFSDIFRHRVEIEGIDVSADLVSPTVEVSESLDAIRLNVYQVNEATVTLKNETGKYNEQISGNFWDTHSLNPLGYRNRIKIYLESLVGGSYQSSLLFSGQISRATDFVAGEDQAQLRLLCVDISQQLQNALISDFGTLEKWDALRQQSNEASYEGVYVPESSLLPIQLQTGTAWRDRTALTLSGLPLASEGLPQINTAHLTTQDLRTAGGFLSERPILKFKTQHRSEDFRFLAEQLAKNKSIYSTHIDVPATAVDDPFILNRGSVPFSVEDTRITRLPTDWVHDSTNDRLLILLSNPEAHITDRLVQYGLTADTYRVLHTFDTGISVHRITRRTSTDYYILSAKAISQDRSASALPRAIDSTGYAYDSIAAESEIKILRYNASAGTLTEHVDETDDRPPQLGIHYHVGFENDLYIDEFEGIVADYRGAFKWYSGNLYYRYATDSEFGVARVNTSGTTTEMIDQGTLNYHNHLNFAFDVTSGGDIYFVYSVGDADESSLIIKRRTSAGVESTILTDTQDLADLTTLDEVGGAYLGCYECLFHDDALYMLCPIQRVDYDADADETTRSQYKAAGMVLFSCDVTAGTPSLTVIEKWDFVSHSACNLIVHDGAVHYTEQPIAASRFLPINSDL